MRLPQRIDPRRSLVAAIAWLIIAMTIGLVIVANLWLRAYVRQTLLEQHGQRLESAVEHVSSELDTELILRLQSVTTVAAMLSDRVEQSEPAQLQRRLLSVLREVPDLSWLAVTDANGDIVAATDVDVIGSNVYQYAWLSQGLDIAWVEEGVMPGERFLKLTAPVRNADGAIIGVVAARMSWSWVQDLTAGIDSSPGQWLLIDRDGIVRRGPPALLGANWRAVLGEILPFDPLVAGLGTDASDLPDRIQVRRLTGGLAHLLARADSARHDSLRKLGWHIVVIEPVTAVAEFATDIEWRITLTLLLLGSAAAVGGIWMARRLTRRISVIARSADAVQAGRADRIEIPPGRDEAARLGSALNRLLIALQRERDDLRMLNAELDQRVAQRTEEIRRLAQEAREAAVGRERLRLARDLHDTLAHSMMAMLTEIRVLKRLASTQPAALSDELVRAEQAAQQGLQEARLAIAQMRSSPVREIGLCAALAELVKGFEERTGIEVEFFGEDGVAAFADERGETLFRMTEELLRNVQRHAGANRLGVALRSVPHGDGLLLEVTDDGIGFDPQAVGVGHYGLVGLHEQAEVIGATVSITSVPRGGTVVRISLGNHQP